MDCSTCLGSRNRPRSAWWCLSETPAARMFRKFRSMAMKGRPFLSMSSSQASLVFPLALSCVWNVRGVASLNREPTNASSNSPGNPLSAKPSKSTGYFLPRSLATRSCGSEMWQVRTRPFMVSTGPHPRASASSSSSSACAGCFLPPQPEVAEEVHLPSGPNLSALLCLASWYSLKSGNFLAKALRKALGSHTRWPPAMAAALIEMLILATSCMSEGSLTVCRKYSFKCSRQPGSWAASARM
mmetsp:Transcript_36550/g.113947  ORF Transcript_36550/g.113947 Transcript_36550/m.113947 type:complete len:242 (-) Transcript_36550:760-1485(-)